MHILPLIILAYPF